MQGGENEFEMKNSLKGPRHKKNLPFNFKLTIVIYYCDLFHSLD